MRKNSKLPKYLYVVHATSSFEGSRRRFYMSHGMDSMDTAKRVKKSIASERQALERLDL